MSKLFNVAFDLRMRAEKMGGCVRTYEREDDDKAAFSILFNDGELIMVTIERTHVDATNDNS